MRLLWHRQANEENNLSEPFTYKTTYVQMKIQTDINVKKTSNTTKNFMSSLHDEYINDTQKYFLNDYEITTVYNHLK